MENYGTALQATVVNIIRRMRLTCSVTTATDTHSEYVMRIAVGYMIVLNVTYIIVWLNIQEFLSYSIGPMIHAVTLPFRFSQRYKQPALSSVI